MSHLLHAPFIPSSSALHRVPIIHHRKPSSSSAPALESLPEKVPATVSVAAAAPVVVSPYAKKHAKELKVELGRIVANGPIAATGNVVVAVLAPGKSEARAEVELGSVVPSITMQSAVSRNMVESLVVPTFKVGYAITTNALDVLYKKVDVYSLSSKWKELVNKARTKQLQPNEYNMGFSVNDFSTADGGRLFRWVSAFLFGQTISVISPDVSYASGSVRINEIFEVGELFDLSIQLIYLVLLLSLLGTGTYFVIRQVLVRRELDLSAKELQEQVRSGDAGATELFELGAVMLRRKFYPAANKYLLQAIEKWDGDNPDLAQVYNALGVSYVRDGKVDKGIAQFETAVKLQPGYVTAWNNLGDAYESKKDYKSALKAFEEVLLFDPNNKVARPRRDSLKGIVEATKGVTVVKSTDKK